MQHAAARGSSASAAGWTKVSRAADKALAVLVLDKRPRSMEISTVCTCQEGDCDDQYTKDECDSEIWQCGVDEIQQCDHAEETEQRLSEDYYRQRCEVRARSGAKMCCRILTALVRKEWKTCNDVPLELRKDTERIH